MKERKEYLCRSARVWKQEIVLSSFGDQWSFFLSPVRQKFSTKVPNLQ